MSNPDVSQGPPSQQTQKQSGPGVWHASVILSEEPIRAVTVSSSKPRPAKNRSRNAVPVASQDRIPKIAIGFSTGVPA